MHLNGTTRINANRNLLYLIYHSIVVVLGRLSSNIIGNLGNFFACLCEKVIFLENGKVKEIGETISVLKRYQSNK